MSAGGAGGESRLPDFFRLQRFDEVDSTFTVAKQQAEAGAPAGTLIVARRQTAGRGRRGRSFASPAGNLYFSLLLRPTQSVVEAAQLSFVAALAVADAIRAVLPAADVRQKWPNDVLLNGGKVCGILLESAADIAHPGKLSWLIAGIGVNVVSHPEGTDWPSMSLHAAGATTVDADAVLRPLAAAFLDWMRRWEADGFMPIRDAWTRDAVGIGEPITVRLADKMIDGRFQELDADGALVLCDETGHARAITAGEVFFPAG